MKVLVPVVFRKSVQSLWMTGRERVIDQKQIKLYRHSLVPADEPFKIDVAHFTHYC